MDEDLSVASLTTGKVHPQVGLAGGNMQRNYVLPETSWVVPQDEDELNAAENALNQYVWPGTG